MSEITLEEVARELGLQTEKSHSDRTDYYCPIHDNETGDLSLYNASHSRGPGFACHNEGGESPVTLVMHTQGYNTVEEALEWLEEHFPEEFSNYDEETIDRREEAREVLNKAAELAHDTLKKQKEEILEDIKDKRNFDRKTVNKAQIGFFSHEDSQLVKNQFSEQSLIDSGLYKKDDEGELFSNLTNRIVFPYRRNQQTYYMIGRRLPSSNSDSKYKKTWNTDYNKHILYEYTNQSDSVIITEGVTDAISVWRAGYDVVSPITTKFRDKDIEKVVNRVQGYDEIYIAMDMDEGGIEGAEKTAEQLTKEGLEPAIIEMEEGYDLDDWTTENGYNIDILLEDADDYFDRLFNKMSDARRKQKLEIKNKIFDIISGWDRGAQDVILGDMPGSKQNLRTALNQYIEQNKKQRDTVQEMPELEEEENDGKDDEEIISSLRIHDKVIEINPSNEIEITQLLQTVHETKTNKKGLVKKEPQFKVYEIKFGEGTEEKEYRLFTEPYRNLNKGLNILPVKRADLSKEKYETFLKQEYREICMQNDDFDKSFDEYLAEQKTKTFEVAPEISKEAQDKITELSNDQILEAIEQYLSYGYELDGKLKMLMYPKIVKHDKTQVTPEEVMNFAPHTQMWTNTKVGKTYVADRVGKNKDDATTAGLVGYADTDGKQKGVLDGVTDPVFIDEFNFGSSSHQMNDRLLGLMERGIHEQSKAGYQIKTQCWSPITYMANPRDDSTDLNNDKDKISGYSDKKNQYQLVEKFEELIEFLGYNIQAMGSRFGIILFDQTLDTASGEDIPADRGDKLKTFLEWVKSEVATEYSKIERELRTWLQTEYSDDYEKRVREVAQGINSDPVVKFWESHIESYRHARGQALRMAVYQNIGDVLKGDYSIEEIKESADQAFEDVKSVNLESLENMANASDSEVMKSRAEAMLKGESPKYVKLFIHTVISLNQRHEEVEIEENFQPFSLLKEEYDSIKEDIPFVSEDSMYWSWSKIKKNVLDNKKKHGFRMEQRYGVKVTEVQGEPMVYVSKPNRFERFCDLAVVDSDDHEVDEVRSELKKEAVCGGVETNSDKNDKHYKERALSSSVNNNDTTHTDSSNSSEVTSNTSHSSQDGVLTTEESQLLKEFKGFDFNAELSFMAQSSQLDNPYEVLTDLEEKGFVDVNETDNGDYVNKTRKLEKALSNGEVHNL